MALSVESTTIPGLLVVRRPVHHDARGWFTEAWQRDKMIALGLPDFGPIQHNVSFNATRGATRGIHGEPWDKFVTVLQGSVFGAWVDLRAGESFGATFTTEIDETVAVFVPRGVGNSYQALADGCVYSYLVNEHWRPDLVYPALALDDPTAAIDWPIPLSQAAISDKDRHNPQLGEVAPFAPKPVLVLGGSGQIGRSLLRLLPDAVAPTREELDLGDPALVASYDFGQHDLVINAAAMTAVDAAETPDGRRLAWRLNAQLPAELARRAVSDRFTLVHYSSDYVFDGSIEVHDEREASAPLGTYGQAKAAGDLAVSVASRHYILRTSWVVGDGGNFVATMARLAREGVSPSVVDDQIGRLAFADEVAAATMHLLDASAPFGTYNVTQSGDALSWAELAREVFAACGRDRGDVSGISSQEYSAGKVVSPRPRHSTLSLTKLAKVGYEPADQVEALGEYVSRLVAGAPRTSTNVGGGVSRLVAGAPNASTNVGGGVSRLVADAPRTSTNVTNEEGN